ncbi:MAG TPA: NUDIX domain-containing protein [Myxococcaceae bacterium]|nr:NUDIX domain-containing protein [Myxococcaceae bacterium]
MVREAIPSWYFALVVVRDEDRFLVVQERKHEQRWYLPAGRVEIGETLADGARREVLDETGVEVELTGVLRIEHTPLPEFSRVRVFYVARPSGAKTPKTTADEHSLQARWVTLAELRALPLRELEVFEVFEAVLGGAPVVPMSVLTAEGAPFGGRE